MKVTPGIDLTALAGPFTKEQINLLGRPTVELEDGDVTPAAIDLSSLVEQLGSGAAVDNYLLNGNFAEPLWSRGTTPTSCPANQDTYRADDWWCRPAAGAVTYGRTTDTPDAKSLHAALVTGSSGATGTVDFGQNVPGHITAALRTTLTLSFWVYNNTGAALLPVVRVDTCDAFNTFTATQSRMSSPAGTEMNTGAWKKFTLTFDASAFPNMGNGARIYIRFPAGSLNNTGKSVIVAQVKLEPSAQATPFLQDPKERQATATQTVSTGGVPRNFLDNASMVPARWFTASMTCTEAIDNWALDGWWVNPLGATGLVLDRVKNAPDTLSLYAARLTGATGVSQVRFGQNLYQPTVAEMRRPMVVSFYLYNGTGAEIIPTLVLETCNTEENFGAVTERAAVALDACAASAWTRVAWSFNGSDYTNWINGARMSLRFADGTLNSGSKSIVIAQPRCETGTSVTAYLPERPESTSDTGVPMTFERLQVAATGDNTVLMTAVNLVLRSPNGRAFIVPSMAETANLNDSGVNGLDTGSRATGWYYIWAISNGSAHRVLFSASGSAPVMPAGYNYSARVGACYNTSEDKIREFFQAGRKIYQQPETVLDTHVSVNSVYEAVSMPAAVPPLATSAWGSAGVSNGYGGASTECEIALSATQTGCGEVCLHMKRNTTSANKYLSAGSWTLPIVTANTVWVKAPDNSVKYRVEVAGFEL